MNKYEMIGRIVDDADDWDHDKLVAFVKDALIEQWSSAPLAAVRREFQLIQERKNGSSRK